MQSQVTLRLHFLVHLAGGYDCIIEALKYYAETSCLLKFSLPTFFRKRK